MFKFKEINDVSIKSLQEIGFSDGDYVAFLLSDGRISCGVLKYVNEYSTCFDVELILDFTYYKTENDLYSAIGICKVIFE